MRGEREYLDGLTQLHLADDEEDRRTMWRQGIAALAAAVTHQRRTVPLEGLDPDALLASTMVALEEGLVTELDFLSPPAAAAALYELAAALPASPSKRALGRRVFAWLHEGDTSTFVAVATRLALGQKRVLSGAPIRARVSLALELPIGLGTRVDGLALALISRRDLEREWLRVPATGALPSRRLAARLLERAASETVRRASEGDDSGLRVFRGYAIRQTMALLLDDGESLVWRHAASARGLLAPLDRDSYDAIQTDLGKEATPKRWRRAAASLATAIAVDPTRAFRECQRLLESDVAQKDPEVSTAMVFGLPRAAEAEPDAVEGLLEHLVRAGGLAAAEALVELRRERVREGFGDWAAQFARVRLREQVEAGNVRDDGELALLEAVADDLSPSEQAATRSLRAHLTDALAELALRGPREARARASEVLEAAASMVLELERQNDASSESRRRGMRLLRELDDALSETDALVNLLLLGAEPRNEPRKDPAFLNSVLDRLNRWLVLHEGNPMKGEDPHPMLRKRRVQALRHLVDTESLPDDQAQELTRRRRLLDAQLLLARVRDDQAQGLSADVCLAAARATDALIRDEIAEISDALIAVGLYTRDPVNMGRIAEGSMIPELKRVIRAYGDLEDTVRAAPATGPGLRAMLDALVHVANELPVSASPRVEALRAALLDLNRALEQIAAAGSLNELAAGGDNPPLSNLEGAVRTLGRLVVGARRRLGEPPGPDESPDQAIRLLDFCIQEAREGSSVGLEGPLGAVAETLRLHFPLAIADVTLGALERMRDLPLQAPKTARTSFLPAPPREAPLPPWMPPSRTLGGFYVVRSLGGGAVSSVFVARRVDQRQDAHAESFALKVPEYDADVARTLSEDQFMDLFRTEAGTLLALPHHQNIARFVNFDAGAHPKPILVMELVEGPTLERVLEMANMTMERAFTLLDGIASGLEVMHRLGLGHLDLKPSNVILRRNGQNTLRQAPVLVDFGLAGRQVRPGCGTAEYAAPEIWDTTLSASAKPAPADTYAFACIAYELITGRTLFDGPHEAALLTGHMSHDGMPPLVSILHTDPRTQELGEILRRALRKDPRERVTMGEVRMRLSRIAPHMARYPWPLGARPA